MDTSTPVYKNDRALTVPKRSDLFRTIFIIATVSLFAIMLLLSFNYGITWDEWMQGHYGKLVLRYFLSGGANQDFMSFAETMYLYGGFFDTITGSVYAVLFDSIPHFAYSGLHDTLRGISSQDIYLSGYYEIRHLINALFGFIAILFTGLIAKELRGWRTACLALLLIVLSPRFFGNCMNNPKDIPFTTAYVLALLGMIRFFKEFPHPRKTTVGLTALGIAMAIGTRIGGLILVFYLFLFSGSYWLSSLKSKTPSINPGQLLIYVTTITLMGYFGGLIFWPYGQLNPLVNPFLAFREFSNFAGAESKILFEGQFVSNAELPWYYLPKWIGISTPLIVLIGFFLFLFFIFSTDRRRSTGPLAILAWSLLFPVTTAMIQKPILYDGWRHFLFVYPSLVILSVWAWESLWARLNKFHLRWLALAGFIFLAIEPLYWMIRNHPNEYTYFNLSVGGIKGANGYYQTDYWGNSLRQAALWLGEKYQNKNLKRPLIVHADGNLMSTYPYLKKLLGKNYLPYEFIPQEIKKATQPDYGIFISKRWPPELIQQGAWPPPQSIYTVTAEGTALCAVVENPSTNIK